MATRMPSSSGALLASLLPLLEALAVVAAADATREAENKDDDIVAKPYDDINRLGKRGGGVLMRFKFEQR